MIHERLATLRALLLTPVISLLVNSADPDQTGWLWRECHRTQKGDNGYLPLVVNNPGKKEGEAFSVFIGA